MSTPREVYDRLLAHDFSSCTVALVMAAKSREGMSFTRVQIGNGVGDKFIEVLSHQQEAWRRSAEEDGIALFDLTRSDATHDHERPYLAEAEEALVGKLPSMDEIAQMPHFDEGDLDYVKNLKYYVLMLTCPIGRTVMAIRHYTGGRKLSTTGKFTMFMQRGQYDVLDESALVFDSRLDAVAADGFVFVENQTQFSQALGYDEHVRSRGARVLTDMGGSITMPAGFTEWCDKGVRKYAKICRIAESGVVDRLELEKVRQVIADFGLDIKADVVGNRLVFDFDEQTVGWDFLKLLDQDYLESGLTSEQFEAVQKRPLGN